MPGRPAGPGAGLGSGVPEDVPVAGVVRLDELEAPAAGNDVPARQGLR